MKLSIILSLSLCLCLLDTVCARECNIAFFQKPVSRNESGQYLLCAANWQKLLLRDPRGGQALIEPPYEEIHALFEACGATFDHLILFALDPHTLIAKLGDKGDVYFNIMARGYYQHIEQTLEKSLSCIWSFETGLSRLWIPFELWEERPNNYAVITDVNSHGEAILWRRWFWDGRQLAAIPELDHPAKINNAGDILGFIDSEPGAHDFALIAVRFKDGTLRKRQTVDLTGAMGAFAALDVSHEFDDQGGFMLVFDRHAVYWDAKTDEIRKIGRRVDGNRAVCPFCHSTSDENLRQDRKARQGRSL
ncbi:MAG: hypothetical protein LLG04_08145 [Parachlamydia sp.]|nr:hypothetical protein [Parachlamydia sp.]